MKRSIFFVSLVMVVLLAFACGKKEPVTPELTQSQQKSSLAKESGDPAVLAKMHEINAQLAAQGYMAVESIEFFTIGLGRPSNRIHQQPFRWVPNDPRRLAQGIDITYLVDRSDGKTASGLKNQDTEAAIDRLWHIWQPILR
jgi:hypothetical protein